MLIISKIKKEYTNIYLSFLFILKILYFKKHKILTYRYFYFLN